MRKRKVRKVWKTRKRKNMAKHFVELVERIMHLTSSGFAVTYVRNGFMGSVSRSLLQGQSILSSINVHLAATRESDPDVVYTDHWYFLATISPLLPNQRKKRGKKKEKELRDVKGCS